MKNRETKKEEEANRRKKWKREECTQEESNRIASLQAAGQLKTRHNASASLSSFLSHLLLSARASPLRLFRILFRILSFCSANPTSLAQPFYFAISFPRRCSFFFFPPCSSFSGIPVGLSLFLLVPLSFNPCPGYLRILVPSTLHLVPLATALTLFDFLSSSFYLFVHLSLSLSPPRFFISLFCLIRASLSLRTPTPLSAYPRRNRSTETFQRGRMKVAREQERNNLSRLPMEQGTTEDENLKKGLRESWQEERNIGT